ncbi:ATP-dependent Clp protease ATP-binding subunit [Jannaschia donghaensis]|uniref:ATP-dependent Clp protease ATP-binding subunit ClpC n=1 Tax=Jannaschia donghaensis TaxID=420998 RepID=A0A0M6YKD5_9RHOB|nr:ATP-dependent Clp protease ATP-binding subunit [Jannaschia donghaensis]CTQ50364.1 ATP-dependent Clp protease ATP-binding subunit ClpC [Jannaschia donghaensis]
MAKGICDICHVRPATVRAEVVEDGHRRTMELCDSDYRRLLARQGRGSSPLEALFGRGGAALGGFSGGDGASPLPRTEPRAERMTDRLSAKATDLLQAAAMLAADRGRRDVDTEHLLLALLDSDAVAAVLDTFKLSLDDLRDQIETAAPRGEEAASDREVSITPRLKDALGRAFAAASEMGHGYVGPEHLLIGLAEEGEGLASDILRRDGLTPQALRQKVVQGAGQGEDGAAKPASATPALDKVSRDLTQAARDGKLDPVIGRAEEIETTIEILARRRKNNPVLIGDPGVGKTAIVEGLAQRIVAGEVPETLAGKRLVELNINSLVAGAKYRGEFEERVQDILKEVVAQKDHMILFIDELHTMMGAGQGGGEGGLDLANTFKPAMARGEMNLIGATTLNEYQKHIEKDAALERRFQPVQVDEPTVAQTIMILHGLRDTFEAHHKVSITDPAIDAAAELSDRYVTGRFLPDKAIDLIDQACARVKLRATARPVEMHEAETELRQLKREQDYAASRRDFDKAADLGKRIEAKTAEMAEVSEAWTRARASGSSEVGAADVAEVVARLTGIPVADLTAQEKEKLLHLEDRLHARVIGQDAAVTAVADAIRLARAGLSEGGRPIATFLFLGPTGVGKTELAKALAEAVFGAEDAIIRLDMSEYAERHTVARLIGAPPGYVGYGEGGQLTEKVRRKPHSVILLDELEKAHGDVYNILLQVFDDGRLTDGKGRVVDFTNTVIIATSNLGGDVIQRDLAIRGSEDHDAKRLRADLMEVLRGHFRPEFINRIDEVVVFQALDREEIGQIVDLQLARVARAASGQGIDLSFDDGIKTFLTEEGYRPEFGARELRRLIRSKIETALSKDILAGRIVDGDAITACWDDGTEAVRFEVAPKDESDRPAA